MTTLRTAAQQALETIEGLTRDRLFTAEWAGKHGATITALRAALAQQAEPVEPVAWVASKDGRVIYDDVSTNDVVLRVAGDFEDDEQRARYVQRIVDKLNAAPPSSALAQQDEPVEPVAWMVYTLDGKSVCVTDNPADFSEKHRALPLYAAPPQRLPLTEEVAALTAQRDALLEALRPFAKNKYTIGFTHEDVDHADAAIKAVEGEKT